MSHENSSHAHELILTRELNASAEHVFRAWTEPALLVQWFAPKPWSTTKVEMELHAGGKFFSVMCNPDGEEFPNHGVILSVEKNRRLVFTDAFTQAWVPSPKAFMTVELTFEVLSASRMRYTARVLHWSAEDKEAHENMGFYDGWGQCTSQLEAVAQSLAV